jgi:hypothetical protein
MLYAEEDLKFDGSFQFSALNLANSIGYGTPGAGGRFGYRFSPFLFGDLGVSYFPGDGEAMKYRKIMALGGIRAGKQFEEFGVFASARGGALSFSKGKRTLPKNLHGKAYPVINIGVMLEWYYNRGRKRDPNLRGNLFFRIDIVNCIIFFGNTNTGIHGGEKILGVAHNPLMELGIGFRF